MCIEQFYIANVYVLYISCIFLLCCNASAFVICAIKSYLLTYLLTYSRSCYQSLWWRRDALSDSRNANALNDRRNDRRQSRYELMWYSLISLRSPAGTLHRRS